MARSIIAVVASYIAMFVLAFIAFTCAYLIVGSDVAFKPGIYDLLLLDIKMNKMGGFELFREIQKKDKNVNACFITAYEIYYESLKHEFPGLNVGCFITKPIDIDSLVKRIKIELEPR